MPATTHGCLDGGDRGVPFTPVLLAFGADGGNGQRSMQLASQSLEEGQPVPKANAMGVPSPAGPIPGPNRSPHLAWSVVPEGTRSFAILCVDPDAPSKPDDVNKQDRTVPYGLPRVDFYHWVMIDIPLAVRELVEGQDSEGLTARGKTPGPTPYGVRGVNNFTDWFAGDPNMSGDYGGYDGPWPPYNDERIHRYVFTLYALDVEKLDLTDGFKGPDVVAAIAGHVLAQASLTCTYSLYDRAR